MTIHLVSDHSNHFPIVNAARIVPIPSPSKCPRMIQVISAVIARQVTSNPILILEYLSCDICQFSREKICRNDWQTTAVGKCDSKTYQKITDYKINTLYPKAVGKALIHISCISSISLNANPTKKLKRYGATNFFRMIISDNTKSP